MPVSAKAALSNAAFLGKPGALSPALNVANVWDVAALTKAASTPAAPAKVAASTQFATSGYASAELVTPSLVIILRSYVPVNPTNSHVPTASPNFGELSSSSQAENNSKLPINKDKILVKFDFIINSSV